MKLNSNLGTKLKCVVVVAWPLVATACAPSRPDDSSVVPHTADESPRVACDQTTREVLGRWAHPSVQVVAANGETTPAGDWQADLWLSDSNYARGGCRFSNASSYRARVFTAARPGAIVQLSFPREHRKLATSGVALTVPHHAPLMQAEAMPNDMAGRRDMEGGGAAYLFMFPPPDPNWQQLQMVVPIEGSDRSLSVTFVRTSLHPGGPQILDENSNQDGI